MNNAITKILDGLTLFTQPIPIAIAGKFARETGTAARESGNIFEALESGAEKAANFAKAPAAAFGASIGLSAVAGIAILYFLLKGK